MGFFRRSNSWGKSACRRLHSLFCLSPFSCVSSPWPKNGYDLVPDVLQIRGVNIEGIESNGCCLQSQLLVQPVRKVVGSEFQAKPGFDKVIVDRMHAHLLHGIGKFQKTTSHEAGWHDPPFSRNRSRRASGRRGRGKRVRSVSAPSTICTMRARRSSIEVKERMSTSASFFARPSSWRTMCAQ